MPKFLITYARKFQLLTEVETEEEALGLVEDVPELGQDLCQTTILDIVEMIEYTVH